MIKESHIREGAAAVTRQDIRALVKALDAARAIANAVTPRAQAKSAPPRRMSSYNISELERSGLTTLRCGPSPSNTSSIKTAVGRMPKTNRAELRDDKELR
jgi:hypothetical protein